MLDAELERSPRGADVGGVGKDFRHREHAVLGMEVVDCVLAHLQRPARVERGVEADLAGIERHRERKRLEGRAHLVHAGGEPVDAGRIERLARVVGVVIRYRHHRDDLAGARVGDEAGGRLGLELVARLDQFVAQPMLHPKIDCQLHRLLQPVGGEPRQVQIGEPAAVEPFLDTGDALIVDVDVADEVGDAGAIGIDAVVLAQEADTGQTEPIDFAPLLGRDLALEPHEAALGTQPLAHLGGIEVG